MTVTAPVPASVDVRRVLTRSLTICAALAIPAMVLRAGGLHPAPVVAMLVYGAAVVAASFLLAWAAEAAQLDISGGLAVAILAFIAVLPEYAVDLTYAYTAGHDPTFVQYAAANMTGSNRLLLGVGWPVVVLVAVWCLRRSGSPARALALDESNRLELGFLLVAGVIAFVMPVSGQIHLAFGLVLLAWFAAYAWRLAHGEAEEPHLIGTSAALGALPRSRRRITIAVVMVLAAVVILAAAEPFAHALVDAGKELGIDEFLLVQWVGPLASEAPEFIVAILFARRGNGVLAIGTLISSKVNQWTLLVGTIPLAYLAGGGGVSLPLDDRQVEEMLLTATQTLLGIALVASLRFSRQSAWLLLVLFLAQFPLTGTSARLVLSAVYAAIALVAFVVNRRQLPSLVAAIWRRQEPPPPA
ncbi:MAG TPA: sodium:proton exchanger [Mycobacteriales bacterium]